MGVVPRRSRNIIVHGTRCNVDGPGDVIDADTAVDVLLDVCDRAVDYVNPGTARPEVMHHTGFRMHTG